MAAMRRRSLRQGERIRVLVVDDSVVIRRLVTRALEQDPEIEVVGAASNGIIALQRIPLLDPDILTLDIEMPEMNGLETLRHLRRDYPDLRVIMFSTLTERGATVTLEALALGADDYVTKASCPLSFRRLRQDGHQRLYTGAAVHRLASHQRGRESWRLDVRREGQLPLQPSCLNSRPTSPCRLWWFNICRHFSRGCSRSVSLPHAKCLWQRHLREKLWLPAES